MKKKVKIVVFAPNWIGDQIMAYPFFCQLKMQHPDAYIHVFCRDWVMPLQFQLYIDACDTIEGSFLKSIFAFLKWRGKWDLGFCLNKSLVSRIACHVLGVKKKIYCIEKKMQHRSENFLSLLGGNLSGDTVLPPVFQAKQQWNTTPLKVSHKKYQEKYFVVAPGSQAVSRQWDIHFFIALAQKIILKKGWACVLVGGVKEKGLGETFASQLDCTDLIGAGSVAQLWDVFAGSQLVLANESGLAHVAALCGARVHIICGAANPLRTKPLGDRVSISVSDEFCWPCEKNTCWRKDLPVACLNGLTPEKIWDQLLL